MPEAPYISYILKIEPIPRVVLRAIMAAEEGAYAKTSLTRYLIESLQEILAFVAPTFVFHRNYSVGVYKIKAKTAQLAIRWAVNHKLLKIHKSDYKQLAAMLPTFIISPRYNETIAKILLTKLKYSHPLLREISWSAIAKDDYLIAKIYSGYMGAGGHIDVWKKTLQPGKVALKRLKCHDGKCRVIGFVRRVK